MRRHYVYAIVGVLLAGVAGPLTSAKAAPTKASLPDPCKLLSVHQVNKALHKSGAKPKVAGNHSPNTKQCGWGYTREYVILTVQRQPAHDKPYKCKPGTKTTHVKSLWPDGIVCQDNFGGQSGGDPEAYVVFVRHHVVAEVYFSRHMHPPTRLIKLAKIVHHKV